MKIFLILTFFVSTFTSEIESSLSHVEENALEISSTSLSGPSWKAELKSLEEKFGNPETSAFKKSSIGLSLGDFYMGLLPYPPTGYPTVDVAKAFHFYFEASKQPIPEYERAQYMVGFILNYHPEVLPTQFLIGSGQAENKDLVKANVPLALVYHQFAASGDSIDAKASLAYKHVSGHNTPVSCKKAVNFYQQACYKQVAGLALKPSIKISTDNIVLSKEYKDGSNSLQEEQEIIYFHTYNADNGNVDSQLAIALIHLQGGVAGIPQDYKKAFDYLKMAHETDPEDGIVMTNLGFMYANGYGVEQENETAVGYFQRAVAKGIPEASTQLGIMSLNGWGTPKNRNYGIQLLESAANENEPWALLQLGRLSFHGHHGIAINMINARNYFAKSAQAGNLVASYNLALMTQNGMGMPANCPVAVGYYKKILDRTIHKTLSIEAFDEFSAGRFERALLRYELAADKGSVLGQKNAAWLFEMGFGVNLYGKQSRDETVTDSSQIKLDTNQMYQHAFRFYQMAAEQQSASAHLKLGDFKFYGLGTEVDISQAAQYYKMAADLRSPQAAFNLGYMHQRGLGLPKDFHLAKRYYDLAVELDKEAYFPSAFGLLSLYLTKGIEHFSGENGLIMGYQWDTVLLVVLTSVLGICMSIRQVLLNGLNEHAPPDNLHQ